MGFRGHFPIDPLERAEERGRFRFALLRLRDALQDAVDGGVFAVGGEAGEMQVVGKRDKEREIYLHNGAQSALADWLAVRGDHRGAIFAPIDKAGHIARAGLTTTAMHLILAKRAKQAGVQNVSLHDFRRTVTGDLLDKGADIASVASLLGHASVNTTARYDRRGQRARIAASQLMCVPYKAA